MGTNPKKSKFLDALARLEWCLETPVIPGEMERWTTNVEEAFNQVEPLLVDEIENQHPKKMKQISKEDPGLLHRVDSLKEQDQVLLKDLEQLRTKLDQLSNKAEAVEPDEARIEDKIGKFVDSGIAFIIASRKQEVAIDTWLMEALERDRGIVD